MRLLPIIGPQASLVDIGDALLHMRDRKVGEEFAKLLAGVFGRGAPDGAPLCVSSGLAAWYLILLVLKKGAPENKREVVLPAYTAGSLVVAVKEAGLIPVLCDVSLDDFNAKGDSLLGVLSENTLAVAGIHMFGIPMAAIPSLAARMPDGVTLVEDCAQAQGALLEGRPVGSFASIGFWSFNRGKNMSLCGGGCICASEEFLAACRREGERFGIGAAQPSLRAVLKVLVLSAAVNPHIYGAAYLFFSRLKVKCPPQEVRVAGLSNFQMSLGTRVLARAPAAYVQRRERGLLLLARLSDVPGMRLPRIFPGSEPAFNRFPVLIDEESRIPAIIRSLRKSGIDSSRIYDRPLHHMFDLGYRSDEFPGACYLAGHLLTLPCHPGVNERDVDTMVRVIKETI